jgi:hypothetical protein
MILTNLILSYLKYPELFLSLNSAGYLSMTSASCCHSSLSYLLSSYLIPDVYYLPPGLFLSVNSAGYLSMTSASCCHSSRMLWRLSSARRRASCASRDATSRRTSALPSLSVPLGAALQRKSRLCIRFLGIARLQPQFPHSCVCERFI